MIEKKGNIDPVGDQKQISAAIEAELVAFGLDLERTAQEYLQRRGISYTGDVVKSVRSEVEKVTDGFRLQFGSNVPHAIFVHEGTRPHWPPAKPIREWVRKKLNVPTKELDSVTFLVQRKISRVVTKAKPFLAVAMRAHIQKLGTRIGQAIEEAANAS